MRTPKTFSTALKYLLPTMAISWMISTPPARAGLTVQMDLYNYPFGYQALPWLSTNALPGSLPDGFYRIESWQQPTNGPWRVFEMAGGNLSYRNGSGAIYPHFEALALSVTNGLWSLWVTNSESTNQYLFAVTMTGITSNGYGAPATILYPEYAQLNVPSQPVFSWSGPSDWAGSLFVSDYHIDDNQDYIYQTDDSLAPDATSWPCPVTLVGGEHDFSVFYYSNVTSLLVCSTPTNIAGQSIEGWNSTANMYTSDSVRFYVTANSFDQFLVARYNFEEADFAGLDTSGNDNNANCGSGVENGQEDIQSADAASGTYAREFFGDTSICFTPASPAYHNLSNALADDFTVMAWIKTSETFGFDGDNADSGAGVFFTYSGSTSSVSPLSITGSKAAFTVRNEFGSPTTLHSTSSVNDNTYHHIAVTRNRTTGAVKLYVDGQLQDSAIGPTSRLFVSDFLQIGGAWYYDYIGLVDDLRIYSAELSAQDIALISGGATASGLVAHLNFDEESWYDIYPQDVSGNNNHMDYGFGFNGGNFFQSFDSLAGTAAVEFYKDWMNPDSGGMLGWNPTPSSLMSTLADSFSISVWVKTYSEVGTPGQNAADGACIVVADVPGSARDLTPIALTGGHVAFTTGGDEGDDTLTSGNYVSDGDWHHIVVTRDRQTGEKRLYIDGQEDGGSPTYGSTDLLNAPNFLSIGVRLDASDSDPDSAAFYSSTGYEGLLDDLQFYNRVITPQEAAFLHANPGQALPLPGALTLENALDTDALGLFTFTTGGDSPWIAQTNITYDSEDAAASGDIGDGQFSWFETIAPVNGDISFWWKVSSTFDSDYVGFFINGVQWDNISGDVDWQESSHYVSEGDVLRWEYYKDGSGSEGDDKAWVDQITFEPELAAPGLILRLDIYRDQILGLGERYYGVPSVTWLHPTPLTTNRLTSPTEKMSATKTSNVIGSGSSSLFFNTLEGLIEECTNGLWTLVINKGHPLLEDTYTFSVSITNLTTDTLTAVTILNPANGTSNVPTNSTFHWSGPTNFTTLAVKKFMPPNGANEVHSFLSPTLTNWPSPPALLPGTNDFNVRYESNDFPHVTFTTPVNGSLQTADYWDASLKLISSATVEFEVIALAPAEPAQLTGVSRSGGNLQFGFITQDGRTHTIEARTNLTAGSWIELTNFTGDGNLQQFTFSTTNPPIRYFRVKTE
ncbi:MAG TPA: LamG domain-containing protein [Verrucomicrobiota bacterium]|nr:LamG domain-containing protein [Verrucomicrobiota bacterium]